MTGIVNTTGARSGIIGTTVGQVTLAKMAGGTDGNLITYDTSGNPAYVATGTSGQVLTSAGAGAVPTFQTAPSPAHFAIYGAVKCALAEGVFAGDADPVDNGTYNYTIQLNTETDPSNIISISSNVVTFSEAGKYLIEFYSGQFLGYQESSGDGGGASGYDDTFIQMSLHNASGQISPGGEGAVVDFHPTPHPTMSLTGLYLGDISASDELHIEINTSRANWEPHTWTGVASDASHGYMKIIKVGT